jgi:hypothetical protein
LIAALNSRLTVSAACLLCRSGLLPGRLRSLALVTSILLAAARVPLFVFRRFRTFARGPLLRFDHQPMLRLAFGLRLLLPAGLLLSSADLAMRSA